MAGETASCVLHCFIVFTFCVPQTIRPHHGYKLGTNSSVSPYQEDGLVTTRPKSATHLHSWFNLTLDEL
ncbi:hypothetical protein BaRGS_00002244, partial [Batillaria attramentaria]